MEEDTMTNTVLDFNDKKIGFKYNTDFASQRFKLEPQVLNIHTYGHLRDFLRNQAILNLIKKTAFLQLYIRLLEEQITEDEYENELMEHSDKYFIELKKPESKYDLMALSSILSSLPKQFSLDEISEIFGIQQEFIQKRI